MAGDDAVLCVVGVGTGCVCHLPSRDALRRLAIFSGSANNMIKIVKFIMFNYLNLTNNLYLLIYKFIVLYYVRY